MALHPDFPLSLYEILPPALRWFPAAEELRSTANQARTNGGPSTYTPDLIVRDTAGAVWIVETKGREEPTCCEK